MHLKDYVYHIAAPYEITEKKNIDSPNAFVFAINNPRALFADCETTLAVNGLSRCSERTKPKYLLWEAYSIVPSLTLKTKLDVVFEGLRKRTIFNLDGLIDNL